MNEGFCCVWTVPLTLLSVLTENVTDLCDGDTGSQFLSVGWGVMVLERCFSETFARSVNTEGWRLASARS